MRTEVAIIGGGPGGATCAAFLANRGISSIIIEKADYPRFHIGESMTGTAGEICRELGLTEGMAEINAPIKRGVRVYGPRSKNTFWIPVKRLDEEGKLHDSTTWQVRRSEFDKLILDKAVESGATLLRGQAVSAILGAEGQVQGVTVRDGDDNLIDVEARVVVDASGMTTFLSNQKIASEKERGIYDRQFAVYSHVRGALRDPHPDSGNTLIFYQKKNHWGWFIPVDDETTSIGIVTPADYFREQGESTEDFYMRELRELNNNLADRVENAELVEDVRTTSNYSYAIKSYTGKGFICIGDAHRFIDPIFSFGLNLAMAEGKMAAETIAEYLQNPDSEEDNPFAAIQSKMDGGMDIVQDIVDLFWKHPLKFTYAAHYRYVEDFINIFAGRIYDESRLPGLPALRAMLMSAENLEYA